MNKFLARNMRGIGDSWFPLIRYNTFWHYCTRFKI